MYKTYLSYLSISLALIAIVGTSAIAAPSAPPPGGYTGGVFSHYFKNIIEGSGSIVGTTSGGVCPTGQVIGGFSVVAGTYGLPICVNPTASDGGATSLTGSLRGTANYIPKYNSTGTGIVNSQIFDDGTNVGIGIVSPTAQLDVLGDIKVNGLTIGRGSGNIASNVVLGNIALISNTTGLENTAIGVGALRFNTTGANNAALGHGALTFNTTGSRNTANGALALRSNTTGSQNTANGNQSMYQNQTGSGNTALGFMAGSNLISGDNNIAIGAGTNFVSTTGSNQLNIGNWIYGNGGNIGVGTSNPGQRLDVSGGSIRTTNQFISTLATGTAPLAVTSTTLNTNLNADLLDGQHGSYYAPASTTVTIGTAQTITGSKIFGSDIVVNGINIGKGSGSLSNNTRMGINSLGLITTGNYNTAIGALTLESNTAGNWNTAVGHDALGTSITGNGNAAFGLNALTNIVSGDNNTGLGYNAGANLVSGSNNIAIGRITNFPSTTGSNQLNIGNWIYGDNGNIGIGTSTNLTSRLTVDGQVRIIGGSPAAGRVLTSDATGLASWQNITYTETDPKIGSLLPNYIPKWVGLNMEDSQVFDNGTTVGIGTSTPSALSKLDIAGKIKITDGTQGSGRVLYGDTNGLASWGDLPADLPVGTVMAFNSASCPAGWAIADGTSGTPDLRGEFIRGLDMGRGVNTGRTLGSWEADMFGEHQHMETAFANSPTGASQRRAIWGQGTMTATEANQNREVDYDANAAESTDLPYLTSASGGIETRPRNVALLYCMKIITHTAPAPLTWYNVSATSSGNIALATSGNVGIGTTTPTEKLEVTGSIKIVDGNQGTGKVLISDGSGRGSWQELPGDLPTGSIMAFNSPVCPAGWVIADGVGGTPDLRGEFIRGLDSGRGVDTGRILGSLQLDQFQGHGHNIYDNYGGANDAYWHQGSGLRGTTFNRNTSLYPWGWIAKEAVTDGVNGTPRFGTETRPRNVALLYCMKISVSPPTASDSVTWMNIDGTLTGRVVSATTGNIGIGTSSPTARLEVAGDIRGSELTISGSVYASAFYYTSDIALKKNIKKIESSLEKVLKLNGYTFNWKQDNSPEIGIIAQEVETVFPELVGENIDATGKSIKTVQYGNLIAPVIEAIKELSYQIRSLHVLIEEQQSDIRRLQQENADLRSRLDAIEMNLAR